MPCGASWSSFGVRVIAIMECARSRLHPTLPLMIAMPLLGWGMLSAAAYPVVLFGGWHLPAILPQSDSVHTLLWDAHFYLAFAFFALILLHVAAALFHALVRRDGVCADQRDEIAAVRPRAHSITSSAEQRRWYFEAERLGGSEIELRRRLKLRLKRTYCGHHFPSG
jgi:hypothetical protein